MAWSPTVDAYRAGAVVARTIPVVVLRRLADRLSAGVARLSPERRFVVERNLRRIYGEDLHGPELDRRVRQTFAYYGRYWLDSFRLPSLSPAQVDAGFSYEGYEHILRARRDGIGSIIALPHLGGWEWAAFWMTEIERVPVTAVVEALEPPELFEWFVDFRRTLGMNVVPVGPTAGREVVRALRNRDVVCLLCDRDITGTGVEVEFFGERTTVPAGPATVAFRTGAPILPSAVYFRDGCSHCVVGPPLAVERGGSLREDVLRVTQDLTYALERLIREAPEQWHLMAPNWPSDHEALRHQAREAEVASSRPG